MAAQRDIVVIGASLGGVEAICTLIRALPVDFHAAILIVQHTGPHGPMMITDILARCTPLAVSYARHAEDIRLRHVYVAPPDRHLVISRVGVLGLDDGPKIRHSRPAADRLFQTAASFYGSRVIGVVLTGGDGDGTDGMGVIVAAGGIGVVQDPAEARDPSMPRNALAGGSAQYCAPIDEIGALLIDLVGAAL